VAAFGFGVDLLGPFVDGDAILDGISRGSRSLKERLKIPNACNLILLFEVFGRKLLFPGDAQFENWSYAMTEAPDRAQVAKLVAEVDFYKVGHHGSLNATPRQWLWQSFKKRKGKQLQTMMSTMSNKHGKKSSHTEVPRRTLVTALRSGSRLKNTQNLKREDIVNITTINAKGA
jgi:hypothetical protein